MSNVLDTKARAMAGAELISCLRRRDASEEDSIPPKQETDAYHNYYDEEGTQEKQLPFS